MDEANRKEFADLQMLELQRMRKRVAELEGEITAASRCLLCGMDHNGCGCTHTEAKTWGRPAVVVAELEAEVERLKDYADRLAAGLPEGMLPADVANLRSANAELATDVERLRHAILDFLRWENEEPHNEAQWLEALELLAEAAAAEGGGE